jgi:ribosomal protein S11
MMSPVLGESEVAMRADRPESLLSNFVADVLREGSLRVGKMADIKGPGPGRESSVRALGALGIRIVSIADVTPVPHNGCRPQKRRRI